MKDNIACAAVFKNGCTSIRNAIGESRSYDGQEVLQFERRVAFARCPFDRLISAYSFFYYLYRRSPLAIEGRITAEALESWESFVDYILENDDEHWDPQWDMLTYNGVYLPTETYKLSQLDEVWGQIWPGFYPWRANKVLHRPANLDYRRDDLVRKYEKDIELWHSL